MTTTTTQPKSMPLSEIQFTAGYLDPAGGKQQVKRTRSKSAIVVIGADSLNRLFVLYTWAERCPTSDIYEKIYEIAAKFKLDIFGIESAAQQSLFVDGVIMDAFMRQKDIPIVACPVPTTISKSFRVRTILQPIVKEGRLFLIKEEHKELFTQINNAPIMGDLIDACASACNLVPKQALQREITQENQQLLEYLRNTGAPPDIIEKASRDFESTHPSHSTPAPIDTNFHRLFNLNK